MPKPAPNKMSNECAECFNIRSDSCSNNLCGKCCRQPLDEFNDSDYSRDDCDFHGVETCYRCYDLVESSCANSACSESHCTSKPCLVHGSACLGRNCTNRRAVSCDYHRCRSCCSHPGCTIHFRAPQQSQPDSSSSSPSPSTPSSSIPVSSTSYLLNPALETAPDIFLSDQSLAVKQLLLKRAQLMLEIRQIDVQLASFQAVPSPLPQLEIQSSPKNSFCHLCGSPLKAGLFCPACGTKQ